MQFTLSQGRLAKGTGILLALPAIFALCGGIFIGAQSQKPSEATQRTQKLESLSAETNLLMESVWSGVEEVRIRTIALKKLRDQSPSLKDAPLPSKPILFWTEYALANGQIKAIVQTANHPSLTNSEIYEDHARTLMSQIDLTKLFKHGVTQLRFTPSREKGTENLVMIYPAPTKEKSVESILAVWIDIDSAFSVFKRFSKSTAGKTQRAYLITQDGTALTHTESSLKSIDYSSASIYTNGIKKMFASENISGNGIFESLDLHDVASSFQRVGSLGIAVVLEEQLIPEGANAFGNFTSLENVAAPLLIVFGFLLGFGIFVAWILEKRVREASTVPSAAGKASDFSQSETETTRPDFVNVTSAPQPVSDLQSPPPFAALPSAKQSKPKPSELDQLAEKEYLTLRESSALLATAKSIAKSEPLKVIETKNAPELVTEKPKSPSDIVQEFQEEIRHFKDSKILAFRLSGAASDLCESPTLFFHYSGALKACLLQAAVGFENGKSPSSLSFPIVPDSLKRIELGAASNKLVSLANYDPLARMILSKLGIAHFEAWAVTTQEKDSPTPELIGVLVVLQAGVQSALQRQNLVRMMRSISTHYENRTDANSY